MHHTESTVRVLREGADLRVRACAVLADLVDVRPATDWLARHHGGELLSRCFGVALQEYITIGGALVRGCWLHELCRLRSELRVEGSARVRVRIRVRVSVRIRVWATM